MFLEMGQEVPAENRVMQARVRELAQAIDEAERLAA